MNWKPLLAAFALALSSASGVANASDTSSADNSDDRVYSFFGKKVCLSNAPPTARCDWRVPALEAPADESRETPAYRTSFTLFGKRYCLEAHDSSCDYRIDSKTTPERVKRFFGLNVCLGEPPQGEVCDLELGGDGSRDSPTMNDKRASL